MRRSLDSLNLRVARTSRPGRAATRGCVLSPSGRQPTTLLSDQSAGSHLQNRLAQRIYGTWTGRRCYDDGAKSTVPLEMKPHFLNNGLREFSATPQEQRDILADNIVVEDHPLLQIRKCKFNGLPIGRDGIQIDQRIGIPAVRQEPRGLSQLVAQGESRGASCQWGRAQLGKRAARFRHQNDMTGHMPHD